MENVESFLKNEYIHGDGSGSGSGYGSICGNGCGHGSCSGPTFGSGDGYGFGDGSGEGSGDGYGDGSGNGFVNVFGNGVDGILQFNGRRVFVVDGIQTAINKVIGNFAKGFMINEDLTTEPCYVAKSGNTFAHGKTIHEAHEALMEKLLEEKPVEERIENFLKEFSVNKKFKAIEFYKWHNILTGSCKFGRDQFAKEHGIDLEKDEFTVKEFIELTKNSYGGDIIKEIERRVSDV